MTPYHKPEPCWLPGHDHDRRDCPTPDRLFGEQETA